MALSELSDLLISPTELMGMAKAVLKAVCGAKGVESQGSKEEMVRRLCGPRPAAPTASPPRAQGHKPPPQQLPGDRRTSPFLLYLLCFGERALKTGSSLVIIE